MEYDYSFDIFNFLFDQFVYQGWSGSTYKQLSCDF